MRRELLIRNAFQNSSSEAVKTDVALTLDPDTLMSNTSLHRFCLSPDDDRDGCWLIAGGWRSFAVAWT